MRNKLTLDMSGQALAQNETLNGYLNILPTTYGDTPVDEKYDRTEYYSKRF